MTYLHVLTVSQPWILGSKVIFIISRDIFAAYFNIIIYSFLTFRSNSIIHIKDILSSEVLHKFIVHLF